MKTIPRLILSTLPCLLGTPVWAQDPPATTEQRLSTLEEAYQKQAKDAADGLRVFWKDGLRMESADKRYKFKLGGRVHYDVGFFSPDDDTKAAVESGTTRIEDGSEFRRARIEMSGEVADRVDWNTSYDFAAAAATNFRNLYLGMKDLPFGNMRFGPVQGALRPRADHQQQQHHVHRALADELASCRPSTPA